MISAIISAYYTKGLLPGRITNLNDQDGKPEIVVVCEAGSKEEEIASEFGCKAVLTLGIPTIYKAWNLGIQACNGEYITNANTDDRLYPGALRLMGSVLDAHPEAAVVYGDSDIVQEVDGLPINRFQWTEGGLTELLQGCFLGPMPVWRKSLHEKYGFFDEEMRSSGDYEFWLRLASKGEHFLHVRQCVGAFRSSPNTASRREPTRVLWEDARARSRYRQTD